MVKHSQSTQRNEFAISLQNLKNEVRNGVHFLHVDRHHSFYKLTSFLMEVAFLEDASKVWEVGNNFAIY